jgi:hypothetical protein
MSELTINRACNTTTPHGAQMIKEDVPRITRINANNDICFHSSALLCYTQRMKTTRFELSDDLIAAISNSKF